MRSIGTAATAATAVSPGILGETCPPESMFPMKPRVTIIQPAPATTLKAQSASSAAPYVLCIRLSLSRIFWQSPECDLPPQSETAAELRPIGTCIGIRRYAEARSAPSAPAFQWVTSEPSMCLTPLGRIDLDSIPRTAPVIHEYRGPRLPGTDGWAAPPASTARCATRHVSICVRGSSNCGGIKGKPVGPSQLRRQSLSLGLCCKARLLGRTLACDGNAFDP